MFDQALSQLFRQPFFLVYTRVNGVPTGVANPVAAPVS